MSPIVAISIMGIVGIFLFIILKNFNIFPHKSNHPSNPSFMKTEDLILILKAEIELSEEEEITLRNLFEITTGNRLHLAFDDDTIARKWLTNSVRAIHASNYYKDEKNNMEFLSYEIYRRISNHRKIYKPLVRYVSEIPLKQLAELHIKSDVFLVEIYKSSSSTITLRISEKNRQNLTEKFFLNKEVTLSFWKFMDARYNVQATISNMRKSSKDGCFHIILSRIRSIKCFHVRKYPRTVCEIPVKFRQEIITTDPETGQIKEEYDALKLGVIDNISLNGCRIIAFSPIPEDSYIHFEFPLFNEIITGHAVVHQTLHSSNSYSLHLEFDKDLPLIHQILIYRYIFAEKI